jgi:hypothetical protein
MLREGLASRASKYRAVPVNPKHREQRQGLSPLLRDDRIATQARAAPHPYLRTQQAAERPRSGAQASKRSAAGLRPLQREVGRRLRDA